MVVWGVGPGGVDSGFGIFRCEKDQWVFSPTDKRGIWGGLLINGVYWGYNPLLTFY